MGGSGGGFTCNRRPCTAQPRPPVPPSTHLPCTARHDNSLSVVLQSRANREPQIFNASEECPGAHLALSTRARPLQGETQRTAAGETGRRGDGGET